MKSKQEVLKNLPAVDKLLALPQISELTAGYGKALVAHAIRQSLSYYRARIIKGAPAPEVCDIVKNINAVLKKLQAKSLKKTINATGIIIHTNLGRAPFGEAFLKNSYEVLDNYCNLEFDLEKGQRGSRNRHVAEMIKLMTAAEDVLIVNNAAAAVMLILRTFAKNKEVLVSRGELIEIGGSFRIPDIMEASDCIMREVGTTNKTKKSDYEKAITAHTALLFKAHKSNYVIKGFTEEVSLDDLVALGQTHHLPVVFDLGSGLLYKINHPALKDEPNVKETLAKGIDLVCFSGDKLLGGPQAGIIAGRQQFIDLLKKEPMLRALRVCKTTLALLENACRYYLDGETFKEQILFHKLLNTKPVDVKRRAEKLKKILDKSHIQSTIEASEGQPGGGTLPDTYLKSYAVVLTKKAANKQREAFAENMYHELLKQPIPVLAVLKRGHIFLDMLTVADSEIESIASAVKNILKP